MSTLEQALRHLDARVAGHYLLDESLRRLPARSKPLDRGLGREESRAGAWMRVVRSLVLAGRATRAEFVFFASHSIIGVADSRWLAGKYDDELSPICNKMREIEHEHGLAEDECWLKGEAPEEHQQLSRDYDRVHDSKVADVFREFGETELAELWEHQRDEFDRLYERGRLAVFERENTVQSLEELAVEYEGQARASESAGCFYGACALFGAAMETLLLIRCVSARESAAEAVGRLPPEKQPRSKDPLHWHLSTLLEVCNEAGWLPELPGSVIVHVPEAWGHQLRHLRNLLHPGRHLSDRPRTFIDSGNIEDAEAIFTLVIERLRETEIEPTIGTRRCGT